MCFELLWGSVVDVVGEAEGVEVIVEVAESTAHVVTTTGNQALGGKFVLPQSFSPYCIHVTYVTYTLHFILQRQGAKEGRPGQS